MVVRVNNAVQLALDAGYPLHLPGTVICPAIHKWSWQDGHQRLQTLAGHSYVEVMISSTSRFRGDFQSRTLQRMQLGTLLKIWQAGVCDSENTSTGIRHPVATQDPKQELYLAQAPLTGSLAPLLEDVERPTALAGLPISSVNIWMNNNEVSTSLHYDPHHNLLCVLSGRKSVSLWPPSATPLMYPHAFCGESSNHSSLELSMHDPHACAQATDAARSCGLFFQIDMNAGDALFLPAGWWHEVHSSPRTIAVNYWCGLGGADVRHMAPFYLRHAMHACLKSACESELDRMRSASMACMHERMGSSKNGSEAAQRKSLVSMAAELLHRHVSAWTQMNSEKRKRKNETKERRHSTPQEAALAHSVHNTAQQDGMYLGSAEPVCASTLAQAASTAATGSKGRGARLSCDAVAISALSHQQLLLLLDLWRSTSPSTLKLWLLQCMSPAAAEALTDCLENGAAGLMETHDVAEGPSPASEVQDDSEVLGGQQVCWQQPCETEAPFRGMEGDYHKPSTLPTSQGKQVGVAPVKPPHASDLSVILCTVCYGDDSEMDSRVDVRLCDSNGEFVLGNFAQQVAAMEQKGAEPLSTASSAAQNHPEELGLEVLGRVFGLVDGALLTKALELRKARWRESCLKTVLKSHL